MAAGAIAAIDALITDAATPDDFAKRLDAAGVVVEVARNT